MLAQLDRRAHPNKELGAKSRFTHAPGAKFTAHRMADEDVHRSKCPLKLLGLEPEVGEGATLRRFAESRLVHGIAIKTSGGERLAKTKQHLFRGEVSMGQERNGMRTGRCGKKSKRGCVCRQHYFFDANAGLNHAREYGPKNQGGDRCCDEPTVSASIHNFSSIEQGHELPDGKTRKDGHGNVAVTPRPATSGDSADERAR